MLYGDILGVTMATDIQVPNAQTCTPACRRSSLCLWTSSLDSVEVLFTKSARTERRRRKGLCSRRRSVKVLISRCETRKLCCKMHNLLCETEPLSCHTSQRIPQWVTTSLKAAMLYKHWLRHLMLLVTVQFGMFRKSAAPHNACALQLAPRCFKLKKKRKKEKREGGGALFRSVASLRECTLWSINFGLTCWFVMSVLQACAVFVGV